MEQVKKITHTIYTKPIKQKELKTITHKTSLIIAFSILALMFILSVPKIYLTSEIYRLSKEVNVLYSSYYLLKEEYKNLQYTLEITKYKKISTKK
jgi:cell division protein FtsL